MKRCVEIELDDETGTFTVSECAPKEEMMAGEEGVEPTGQTFESAEEAMSAAMELLTADGRSPEDAEMAGYLKGAPAIDSRPKPQAVFGE